MIHDLGAINASLRLGDKFFPPEGVLCLLKYRGYRYYCIVKVIERVDHGRRSRMKAMVIEWLVEPVDMPRLPDPVDMPRLLDHEISWYLERLWEVLKVPDEAPPFEDWERS